MEIDDKDITIGDLDMDNGQRGSNIEEWKRIKILRQREAHK
jgi:hypothetical protein